MPAAGPKTAVVLEEAKISAGGKAPAFAMVDVTSQAQVRNVARPKPSLAAHFGEGARDPGLRIAVGDVVSVSLWEAPPGTLFGATATTAGQQQASGGSVTIPQQVVNSDRTIAVPYVGRVVVAGRTPAEVERSVVSSLAGKAVMPQALVTVQQSTANTVTVTGEVAGGARVSLSPAGDRLLDAVAAAGGLRASVNESVVYLTRRGTTLDIPFASIVRNPRENVRLRPGDVVTVVQEPRTYTVLGATGQNAEVQFSSTRVTMANALARAGGLLDNRADAAGVFLLRYEPRAVASRVVPPGNPVLQRSDPVPVVYRFNLKSATTLLAMQDFDIQPRDIVYVSNASGIDLQKFLALFQGISGPALSATSVGIAAATAN
ncbi:polysaccharide biosynthesis/export family protein [Rhizobium puerariae]|uniref:Polysaccharide biosynthesis/export family protein n=1 Tax=Rhizobium puerariae TaxID=1585791 RepID=A0ABV6AEH9_9HYPH